MMLKGAVTGTERLNKLILIDKRNKLILNDKFIIKIFSSLIIFLDY